MNVDYEKKDDRPVAVKRGKNSSRGAATLFFVMLQAMSTSESIAEELRDVKPPVEYPVSFWPLILLIFFVFLAVILLIYLKKRKRGPKKENVRPEIKPPAWEIALAELEKLKAENFPFRGMIKKYFDRLSDIVRRYIEERFNIRAPEMTTEEFLSSLKHSNVMNSSQKEALETFLNRCDMVKFANYPSTPEEIETTFLTAKRLVLETKVSDLQAEAVS